MLLSRRKWVQRYTHVSAMALCLVLASAQSSSSITRSSPGRGIDTAQATSPSAPQNVVAIGGNGQATVSFDPPANDGGASIFYYAVGSNPGGETASGSGSPLIVTGLTNGTSYTFTVTATNAAHDTGPGATSNAVTPVPNVPGPPQNVTAVAGNGQATLNFSAPANNGGALVTSYTVTSNPGGWSVSGAAGPLTITGLTDGVAYTFTVTATNSAGTGPASPASNSATPHAASPGAPLNVSASAGNVQATVSFSAPTSNGGALVDGYTVTSSPGGVTASSAGSPLTVNGLTNGTTYTFSVTATNSAGTGPASAASNGVTPATIPGAPQNVSAAAGNGQVTVNFSPPASNGGAPITGYIVVSSPSGLSASGSGNPLTVTGLSNGTAYSFQVTAMNVVGTGPASAASNSVVPQSSVPGAPQSVAAVAGNASATVSFVPPVGNGGAAITNFTVTSMPGGVTAQGAGSPILIGGLTNGTPYTFQVTATNSTGTGPASPASNSVTPLTVPGPPVNVSAAAGNGQAMVSFGAPLSDGGATITAYTVTASPGGLTVSGASSPLTIAGLTNGTSYNFTLTATNSAGVGPASGISNSVTPGALAGPPQNVSATAGNGQATITFAAPLSNSGTSITSYTVTASPGGLTASGSGSPLIVTGLSNGTTYTFTVTATNSAGVGPASLASNSVTPAATPGTPLNVIATAASGQATVAFTAPPSNGGSPITVYTVTSVPGGLTASGASSPITITGLANGINYTFTVTATNSAGTGPGSSASNSVTPASLPGAPQNVTAVATNGAATISFSAPTSTGGVPITAYTVSSSPGGLTASGPSSPLTISGLTNGVSYTFTVTATNSVGAGPGSAASTSVTPATVPSAPQFVTAAALDAKAIVNFSPPTSDGGAPISSYTVLASPGGLTASGTTAPLTVTGLTNGTAYTFTVAASNRVGPGPGSSTSNSVTPSAGPTLPGAPQNVSATAGNGQATITFAAPASDGGTPIVSYIVTASPGGLTATGSSAPLTISGLSNGTTYSFTVTAVNGGGAGPASAPSNGVTPAGIPGAPQNVAAQAGNAQASILFSAPASTGGAPILTYTATSSPDGISATGPASPLIVTGLANGKMYSFTVTATNSAGTGPGSSASNIITPQAGLPSAPLSPSAVAGNRQATISFLPPLSDGGSTILFYTVTSSPGGISVSGPASPLPVTGLTNGVPYSFTITATNSIGTGPAAVTTIPVTPSTIRGLTLASVSNFPIGIVDVDYPLQILSATGGTPPYSFTIGNGNLPDGLDFFSPQFDGIPDAAGTFTFDVTVTDATGAKATGKGSIVINPPHADLILSQSLIAFGLSTGSHGVPDPASVTIRSSAIDQALNYSVSVSSPTPWLDVIGGGVTPGSLGIALDASALSLIASPAPYQATINVACIAPSTCAGTSQTITVSLTVSDLSPRLSLSSSLLAFQTPASSGGSLSQPLGLQNSGGGLLTITSITAADPWVSVSGAIAALAAGPAVPITVTVNPAGLSSGYHTSSVTVASTAGSVNAAVSLLIADIPAIALAPSGAQFQAPSGSVPGNANGSFTIGVPGNTQINWTATVLPGAPWLKVSTPSGTASAASPAVVLFSLDPVLTAALASKTYYAAIRVLSGDVSNSPLDFEIVLNVLPSATPVKVNPSPGGLVFLYPGPQIQTVEVYSSSAAPLVYQASASTIDASNWLSVSPASGSASSSSPGRSSVSVDPSGLSPGTYRGTVSYAFSSAAVRSVNITLMVTGSAISTLTPCLPSMLVLTQVGLVENFQQPVGWPAPLDVSLLTDCGTPPADGLVTAAFSNGDPPLTMTAVDGAPGHYSATWIPRAVSAQVTITSTATSTSLPSASVQITGQVTASLAPILSPNAILHIFNPLLGAALAPGTIVQIYGSNLASNTASSVDVPLSTSLAGTSVWIGGIPAPLYYVSPGQINAQIPFELMSGSRVQVQVDANGAASAPESIQLAAVAPGIAALPSGLAIAQRYPDYSLVTESSPAKPGDYIVLYLAGLGPSTLPVASGSAAPDSPLAQQVIMPSLTLNNTTVPIAFAGLTPGAVGLYQINFLVPTVIPDGDLTLSISQSGSVSNSVILPVKH